MIIKKPACKGWPNNSEYIKPKCVLGVERIVCAF